MRSLIIIEVEHGETLDPVNDLMHEIQTISQESDTLEDLTVLDYNVRIDIPEWYVVRSWDNPPKEK